MSSHGPSQVHMENHLRSLVHYSHSLTCLSSWMKSSTMALMRGAFGECRESCSVFRANSRTVLPFSSTDSTSAKLRTQPAQSGSSCQIWGCRLWGWELIPREGDRSQHGPESGLSPGLCYNLHQGYSWLSTYHSEDLPCDDVHRAGSHQALTYCKQSTG